MMDVPIACICPGGPHEQDTITLKDKLDFRTAVTMQEAVTIVRGSRGKDEQGEDIEVPAAEVLAALDEAYLLYGVEAWTLVNDRGKSIPVNPTTVAEHLVSNLAAAMAVFEEAEKLYNPVVLLPLVMRGSKSSQPTPTDEPTSPPTGSPLEPPKPSKPSSTTTSPTGATEPTSLRPAGDSKSSQNSASAA